MVILCEHSCEINILYMRRSTSGVHSDFYHWSVLLVWGVRKKHINWFIAICCLSMWHLMLIYEPLGCCKELWPKPMLQIDLVCTDTLSAPCGHATETRDTTGRVLDGYVWRHRCRMCISESCICAIATKLPMPLPGSCPDCVVSVGKLCGTATVHMARVSGWGPQTARLPFLRGQARIMTLQQDNEGPHVERVVMDLSPSSKYPGYGMAGLVTRFCSNLACLGWSGPSSVAAPWPDSYAARTGRSSPWGVAGHPTGLIGKLGGVYATAICFLR